MTSRLGIALAIETSNPSADVGGGICLGTVSGPDEIPEISIIGEQMLPRHGDNRGEDGLMPAIAALCREHEVGPRDLARVAVSIGPGGYSAIRIAVTVAKMICQSTGAKCIAVPTAEGVARGAPEQLREQPFTVLLAWKRDTVWRQDFLPAAADSPPRPAAAGRLVQLEEAAPDDPAAGLIADARLLTILREKNGPRLDQRQTAPPVFAATAILAASASHTPVDPLQLTPLYPREPEAVSKWRHLHGGGPAS